MLLIEKLIAKFTLSRMAEYSKSSVKRCSIDKGSEKLTGIGILLNSLPMQFFIIAHKLEVLSGLSGIRVRRCFPVAEDLVETHSESDI